MSNSPNHESYSEFEEMIPKFETRYPNISTDFIVEYGDTKFNFEGFEKGDINKYLSIVVSENGLLTVYIGMKQPLIEKILFEKTINTLDEIESIIWKYLQLCHLPSNNKVNNLVAQADGIPIKNKSLVELDSFIKSDISHETKHLNKAKKYTLKDGTETDNDLMAWADIIIKPENADNNVIKKLTIITFISKAFTPRLLKEEYLLEGEDLRKFYFVVNNALSSKLYLGIKDFEINEILNKIETSAIVNVNRELLYNNLSEIRMHLFAHLNGVTVEGSNRKAVGYKYKDEPILYPLNYRLSKGLTISELINKLNSKYSGLRELQIMDFELGLIEEGSFDYKDLKEAYEGILI